MSAQVQPNASRPFLLRRFFRPALAIVALVGASATCAQAADSQSTINASTADLTQTTAYTPNGAPTANSDVVLNSSSTGTTTYTDGGTLIYGSLNDTSATTSFAIDTASGANGILDLGGNSGNAYAAANGGSSSDLIYVDDTTGTLVVGPTSSSGKSFTMNVESSGDIDVDGTNSLSAGGTLNLGQPSLGKGGITISGTGSQTLTFTGTGTTLFNGTMTGVNVEVSSGSTLAIQTDGSNTANGNNEDSGIISNGTITVDANGTLDFGRSTVSLSVTNDITDNGTVERYSGSYTSTFSGVISGTGNFYSNSAATTDLSNANTFSGSTTLTTGSLELSNQLALQDSTLTPTGSGKLIFDSAVTSDAFTLGGLTGTSTSVVTLSNNATTPAAIALSVGNNNTNQTYGGIVNGLGSLVKVGSATQILSASTSAGKNSYSGSTSVMAGTLGVQTQYSIPSTSALSVAAGANFAVGAAAGGSYTGASGPTVYSLSLTSSGLGSANEAQLSFDIGSGATSYDSLTSTNAFTLSGAGSKFELNITDTGTTGSDTLLTWLNSGSNISLASIDLYVNGTEINSSYNSTYLTLTSGTDDTLAFNLAAAPEPRTAALFVVGNGLLLLFLARRRAFREVL